MSVNTLFYQPSLFDVQHGFDFVTNICHWYIKYSLAAGILYGVGCSIMAIHQKRKDGGQYTNNDMLKSLVASAVAGGIFGIVWPLCLFFRYY